MHRLIFASAISLLLTTPTAGTAAAQTIEGSATFRERMAVPPTAVFEALLEDVSRAGAPAETIARTSVPSPGNPPIAFKIAYDPARIQPNRTYVVRARILVDGQLFFTTDEAHRVITGGNPTTVNLMMRSVDAGQAARPTTGGNKPLVGTYWRATELAGKPAPPQDPTRETHLQFHQGRVSGSDGCNLMTGSYHLSGDRVTFGQMAGTQMACINPGGTEGPFRDALKRASRLTVAGDRLELLDAAGTRLAAFVAGTPPTAGGNKPLEATYWRATELAGKPAAPPQEPTREPHLQFHQGRVSGADGCNLMTGSYHLNGDRVTFSQMAGTQMACANMEATEGPFRDALKNASRLTVKGDRMELFDAAGTRLAAFVAGTRPSDSSKPGETKALTGFAGTSWQLVKFQSMDDTTLKPDDRSKYTIEFQGGGRLAVRIDCNRGTGTWKSAGETQIEFGPLALTRAQCPPGSLYDQIVKQWPNIRSYVLRDGHLFLALKMDSGIYEFEPIQKK